MTADFASAVDQALTEGRELIESLMQDACTITRAGTGSGPWNESTGQYDKPARTTVYSGKCRLQVKAVVASSTTESAGDRAGIAQELELQLPVAGTDSVAVRDVAEITSAVSDASLVGRNYTVSARHEKSQATARRLRVITGTG